MGTYTFAPKWRGLLLASAGGLTGDPLRLALVRESGQLWSRYLKRVRKYEAVRYMAVPELHRDGMVHWHALLHCKASWRSLAKPWDYGFSKINLVEDGVRSIRYVTKYLAKDKLGRVRASLGYGVTPPKGDSSEGLSETAPTRSVEIASAIETKDWWMELVDLLGKHGYVLSDGVPDKLARE